MKLSFNLKNNQNYIKVQNRGLFLPILWYYKNCYMQYFSTTQNLPKKIYFVFGTILFALCCIMFICFFILFFLRIVLKGAIDIWLLTSIFIASVTSVITFVWILISVYILPHLRWNKLLYSSWGSGRITVLFRDLYHRKKKRKIFGRWMSGRDFFKKELKRALKTDDDIYIIFAHEI